MMRFLDEAKSWAVYRIAEEGKSPSHVICDQREWDDIEKRYPGHYTLIRGDITNEGEAERLARGTAGDTKPRTSKTQAVSKR